jgi:hypothetical protein
MVVHDLPYAARDGRMPRILLKRYLVNTFALTSYRLDDFTSVSPPTSSFQSLSAMPVLLSAIPNRYLSPARQSSTQMAKVIGLTVNKRTDLPISEGHNSNTMRSLGMVNCRLVISGDDLVEFWKRACFGETGRPKAEQYSGRKL